MTTCFVGSRASRMLSVPAVGFDLLPSHGFATSHRVISAGPGKRTSHVRFACVASVAKGDAGFLTKCAAGWKMVEDVCKVHTRKLFWKSLVLSSTVLHPFTQSQSIPKASTFCGTPAVPFGLEISPEAWRAERFLSTTIDPDAIALI
jgi:hypothetical protein